MANFLKKLIENDKKELRSLEGVADKVISYADRMAALDDEELRDLTESYKERYQKGETLDDLLPEAFAVVREGAKRVLGLYPYKVQIMGGITLHKGNIAEMKTGEGKTLTATMPVYLNALSGEGVHVVTVNEYLASRDAVEMGELYRFLGLTVGLNTNGKSSEEKREAYNCDITYSTNNELGFDYLRDNMVVYKNQMVQRPLNFAVVDEVDSILIDEARTPLIISGQAEKSTALYNRADFFIKGLKENEDYTIDLTSKSIALTDEGIEKAEKTFHLPNLYDVDNTRLVHHLDQALRANYIMLVDIDYVVEDGKVKIVDQFTGRIMEGRRYSDGLHQAIEAKENVEIENESKTMATITFQNYFRMYDKLSGMTGTAKTEESEFQKIYGLGVLPIETNKPMIRVDAKDLIYRTEAAKFEAVVDDVAERHEKGQPILIGTASVAKSEILSKLLKKAGVKHEVLNAKNHAREAAIIALAGRKGAVTVATNMAGRGTDIILGGNPEFLADAAVRAKGLDPVEHAEEYEAAWAEVITEIEEQVQAEHDEVVELGGLYVVGSERHESRRIDNQLRGRSGRQGDPGESRFYLSLEDDLMRLFKSDIINWVMVALKVPDDVPIENKRVSSSIQQAQEQVEAQNFEMRKNVLKYDDVMNRQRHAIYGDRRRVLEGADVEVQLRGTVDSVVEQYVRANTEGFVEDWDLEQLWTQMGTLYPVGLDRSEYEGVEMTADELVEDFKADAQAAYDRREEELGEETMRELERQVLLTVLDRKWREHLYEMDYLREGIGLRAMAQRDPLVEYQREGGDMFNAMMEAFMEEVVGFLFNLEVNVQQPTVGLQTDPAGVPMSAEVLEELIASVAADEPDAVDEVEVEEPKARPVVKAKGLGGRQQRPMAYSAPSETGDAVTSRGDDEDPYAGVGRNAPCPCGSGKKYKMCHGRRS